MPIQNKLDKTYLQMAILWGNNMSRARRKKVGALLVKNGQIISDGYNGTPKGFDNNCEIDTENGLVTKREVLHAESNCITKVAKSTNSSDGSILYITCSPCIDCAKLIIQSGIIGVVYGEIYRDSSGIDLLIKAGIKVEQIDI